MRPTSAAPTGRRCLAALSLGLLALACGPERERPTELQGAVLILLDTARADRFSCYGAERETTPEIDALAAEGTLFETVVSYAPWTLPAVRGLLTGSWNPRLEGGRLQGSLVEQIRRVGYRTAAFTEGGFLDRKFGFDAGFERYEQETGPVRLVADASEREGLEGLDDEETVRRTFRAARAWLEEHRDERFFLLVHTYEPHTPYVRRDFSEALDAGAVGDSFRTVHLERQRSGEASYAEESAYVRALYDGGLRECDRRVGELLGTLEQLGLDDRTLVVVTSDHGEDLGDRYPSRMGDHGHGLSDVLVRVPLVVRDPLLVDATPRVSSAVRSIDVLPTVAERLGVALDGEREGASLVRLLRGAHETGRIAFGGGTKSGPSRLFVRHLGYKYVWTVAPDRGAEPLVPAPPPKQLYDLTQDPDERHNLFEEEPERAARIEQLLRGFRTIGSAPAELELPPDLDLDLKARLESLGYL